MKLSQIEPLIKEGDIIAIRKDGYIKSIFLGVYIPGELDTLRNEEVYHICCAGDASVLMLDVK